MSLWLIDPHPCPLPPRGRGTKTRQLVGDLPPPCGEGWGGGWAGRDGAASYRLELQDHLIHGQYRASGDTHLCHTSAAFGFEDVFHFHRFDEDEGLAGFDHFADCHVDADDLAR